MVVALMVAPALGNSPADGFPLSTYPMFAADRGREATIATAVGLTASGEVERLTPVLLAGTDEPILAVRTADLAVSTGDSGQWCEEVATRVARAMPEAGGADQGKPDQDQVLVVQVRRETHDVTATVVDGAEPLAIEVHAECRVDRG